MPQVDQAAYFLLAAVMNYSNYCKGAVLNVGLGPGVSARAFLQSPYVTRVSSVEILQSVADAYRVKYPVNEAIENGSTIFVSNPGGGRHNLRVGDAATIPTNQINPPFNFVYMDVIQDWTNATINNLKAIATRLKQPGAIAANGVLCVQWYGDALAERQARQWMEDQGWTTEIVRPALAESAWGRAANMLVYHP